MRCDRPPFTSPLDFHPGSSKVGAPLLFHTAAVTYQPSHARVFLVRSIVKMECSGAGGVVCCQFRRLLFPVVHGFRVHEPHRRRTIGRGKNPNAHGAGRYRRDDRACVAHAPAVGPAQDHSRLRGKCTQRVNRDL